MTKYVIDSSTLNEIQDKYPNDIPIFNPLYSKLDQMFENGELFSLKTVYEELRDSKEYWQDYEECFRNLTSNEVNHMYTILNSDDFSVFVKYGLEENEGDYWDDPELIACAMEDNDVVVVSQESSRKHPQRKIPYVCEQLGIRCIKSLEFLKEIL